MDDVTKIIALNAAAGRSPETAPAPPAEVEEGEASEESMRTQAMQVEQSTRKIAAHFPHRLKTAGVLCERRFDTSHGGDALLPLQIHKIHANAV